MCDDCCDGWTLLWRRRPRAITVQDCPDILVNTPGHKVQEAFRVRKRTLGKGGFSTVKLLTNRKTGAACVMKEIRKSSVSNLKLLQEEVKLQASMDHPHIARLFETFEDEQFIKIVMEHCEGGNVLHLIKGAGALPQSHAAHLFRQLICALIYMHQHCHVVHRDIKPENLVLKEKDMSVDQATVKLIDFGFAREFSQNNQLKTICGTPIYVAPEVFSGSYTEKCDIWSSGVTLYYMVCGRPPFQGDRVQVILREARKGLQGLLASSLSSSEDREVEGLEPETSHALIELVEEMCELLEARRPSAQQVLESQWLRLCAKSISHAASCASDEIAANLQNFSEMNPLKKAALNTIVHVIDDSDIQHLRETFECLDTRGEGTIPLDTLHTTISKSTHRQDADSICRTLAGEFKEMDYSNWLSANVQPSQYLKEQYCWEAFRILDKDSSGKISVPELCQVLAKHGLPHLDETHCEHLLAEFDKLPVWFQVLLTC